MQAFSCFFSFPTTNTATKNSVTWTHDWKSQAQPNHGHLLNFILKTSRRGGDTISVWLCLDKQDGSQHLQASPAQIWKLHPPILKIWLTSGLCQHHGRCWTPSFFPHFLHFLEFCGAGNPRRVAPYPLEGTASARRLLLLQIPLPLFARYRCSRESDKGADLCISAGLVLT